MLGDELQRKVDGKAVGVVQEERVAGRDPLVARFPRPLDQVLEQARTLRQRAAKALLLGGEPLADRVALLVQLAVLLAHQFRDPLGVAHQEPGVELQGVAALEDRPAHDPPQHVAAVLVRGDDAVGDQEGHRAAVVGEDPQRAVGGKVLAVATPGELLTERDQRRELVGLEHRGLVLEDRRHPVEPQPGVDVLRRQRRQHALGVLVELHEHQVPVLEEALVLAAGKVVRAPQLDATVEVQLRAGAAGPRRADLPEVLRARALDDPLARNADLEPGLYGLLVGTESELLVTGEHRDPDVLLAEPEPLPRQRPRVVDGLALEVVPEREVAEHLEEREVPGGRADDLDVGGAKRLLARRRARMRRTLRAQEVRLQWVHPRHREQSRGVELGGHQRRRGQPPVVALLEELEVRAPDVVRGHLLSSVCGQRAWIGGAHARPRGWPHAATRPPAHAPAATSDKRSKCDTSCSCRNAPAATADP